MRNSSGAPRRGSSPRALPPRKGANHRKQTQVKRTTRQKVLKRNVVGATPWIARFLALGIGMAALAVGGFYGWRTVLSWKGGPIKNLTVVGNSAYETGAVLKRAGLEIGMPWLQAPLSAARDSLLQLPGIQSVKVKRIWPLGVKIVVKESSPVAVFKDKRWKALGRDGSIFPHPADGYATLPVAEGVVKLAPTERIILAEALAAIRAKHPDLALGFSQVALRGSALEVTWREGGFKLLLDPMDKSLVSMDFLRALLRGEGSGWSGGTRIDLRTEGWAYVQ